MGSIFTPHFGRSTRGRPSKSVQDGKDRLGSRTEKTGQTNFCLSALPWTVPGHRMGLLPRDADMPKHMRTRPGTAELLLALALQVSVENL